jgi:hypothetical protein
MLRLLFAAVEARPPGLRGHPHVRLRRQCLRLRRHEQAHDHPGDSVHLSSAGGGPAVTVCAVIAAACPLLMPCPRRTTSAASSARPCSPPTRSPSSSRTSTRFARTLVSPVSLARFSAGAIKIQRGDDGNPWVRGRRRSSPTAR